MKLLVLLALVSSTFAGVIHSPVATDKVLVNTGASAQYRSQDNLGNYAFGYNEEHATGGTFRREAGNAAGQVVGSYGLRGADGRVRIVNYVADDDGFRADINTNEPGVEPRDPAAVTINKPATVAVAPAATVVASPIVQERVLAAPVAPVYAAGKTVVAPVQQIVEQAPIVQVREEPIVQRYVPPVAPIVQEKVVEPVVQQYEAPVYHEAPIVQQKVIPQIYERPIVQERYVAPIVQEKIIQQPIVQQHIEPTIIRQERLIEQPIIQQQHVEPAIIRQERLIEEPVVQQYIPPVAPIVKGPAPVYSSYYEPEVRPVAAPLVGGIKGLQIPARSPFASPAKLIKGSSVPVVIGQNDETALELVDTYAHPASFGYSLGMPSTWGYTYVVRRKK